MTRFALVPTSIGDASTITTTDAGVVGLGELQSEQPSDRAQFAATDFELEIDCGSAVDVDVIALLRTTLSPAARWTVGTRERAGGPVTRVAPSATFSDSPDPRGWSDGRLWLPRPRRARYWQIAVADGTRPGAPIEIGRLILGRAWSPAVTIDRDVRNELFDDAERAEADSGPVYPDPKVVRERISVSLSWMTTPEAEALRALLLVHGTTTPLWAVRRLDDMSWRAGAVYGLLAPPIRLPDEPHRGIHRTRLQIEEML